MAKPLTLVFRDESIDYTLHKVDRTKLYGYVETEVVDEAGKPCELGTLADDGHSVIGKGGTANAYLSADGQWRSKSDLHPVNASGDPITPVKSSFDAPIPLDTRANVDDYLSHTIHLIYHLSAEEPSEPLAAELANGAIFRFPFSYRGGLEASVGFLLASADGAPFLCVGAATNLEFVGLTATAATVAEPTAVNTEDDDDGLDFGVM